MLEKIDAPASLRLLNDEELTMLASDIREEIIEVVSKNGGHLASSLGVVELTIALHRVFETPQDSIVWDVSHQAYAHKLLTGRRELFATLRQADGCSGFQSRRESVEFDPIGGGHAGTAISAALGLEVAAMHKYGKEHPRSVAVVGDGSLNCGISLEGINNVTESGAPLVIVLNDNRMSISSNVGALPRYLNRVISARSYRTIKGRLKRIIGKIPFLYRFLRKIEDQIKSILLPSGLFEGLGFRYLGPVNGHNIEALTRTLTAAKESDCPVVVHVVTDKGQGYDFAKNDPETYHGVAPFNPSCGVMKSGERMSFSSAFGRTMKELAGVHADVVAITAAMSAGTGLNHFAKEFPLQFFDVGIAEEHAVVFASGLAAGGLRPVVAIYSTFMQRAFDPIYHDVVIQNLPVILAMDRAGAVEDGPTHHGIYDLAFLQAMPNLTILAPADELELRDMLFLAYRLNGPVAIRYSRGSSGQKIDWSTPQESIEAGCAKILKTGTDVSIWSYGKECWRALEIAKSLENEYNISACVVNARSIKPFDKSLLKAQVAQGLKIYVLEDHVISGGLGSEMNKVAPVTQIFAWPDKVIEHGDIDKIRVKHDLGIDSIVNRVAKSAKKGKMY